MKAIPHLPVHYKEIYSVNLQKDKKAARFLHLLALLIAAAMVILANHFIPISSLFDGGAGLRNGWIRFLVLIISLVAYMCLHELIHGMVMKICGTKKVRYGFTGMYFFAGSDDYYGKKSYITIALAPVVVFLFVLTAVAFLVPRDWFWTVYAVQICNIAGAAGDIFVTIRFANMPKDIVIKDSGVSMTVYSESGAAG